MIKLFLVNFLGQSKKPSPDPRTNGDLVGHEKMPQCLYGTYFWYFIQVFRDIMMCLSGSERNPSGWYITMQFVARLFITINVSRYYHSSMVPVDSFQPRFFFLQLFQLHPDEISSYLEFFHPLKVIFADQFLYELGSDPCENMQNHRFQYSWKVLKYTWNASNPPGPSEDLKVSRSLGPRHIVIIRGRRI